MFRTPHVIIGICVILLGGTLQAVVAPAVDSGVAMDTLAARLKDVPLALGDWQGEDLETNEAAVRAADCAELIQRRYTSTRDSRQISLLLLVGKPGPLSVHLPEVCYRGAGYRSQGTISKTELEIDSQTAEFRVVDMADTNGQVPRHIRIYHSWSNGSGWTTPGIPRLAFARSAYLFKLYVTTPPTSSPDPADQDACRDFIASCLPAIDRVLFVHGAEENQ